MLFFGSNEMKKSFYKFKNQIELKDSCAMDEK